MNTVGQLKYLAAPCLESLALAGVKKKALKSAITKCSAALSGSCHINTIDHHQHDNPFQWKYQLDYKERELALNPRVSHEVVKILQWILGYAGMVSLVLAGVGLAISQGTYMTRDEMERPVVKESFSWKFNGVIFVFATLSMYTYSIYANIGKFDRR